FNLTAYTCIFTLSLHDALPIYVLPHYFVYAGLVFTPLSLDYMKTLGQGWRDVANAELIYELYYRRGEAPDSTRTEPVVLASTLRSEEHTSELQSRENLVCRLLL